MAGRVRLVRDPIEQPRIKERCCFCRLRTWWWTADASGQLARESVACCPDCAKTVRPEDVPTKAAWFQQERILDEVHGRLFRGDIARIEKMHTVPALSKAAARALSRWKTRFK